MTVVLIRGDEDTQNIQNEGRPRVNTERRWPAVSQGERPQEKPNLLTP